MFPFYQQTSYETQTNETQTICTESCKNYVSDGTCAVHVKAMVAALEVYGMHTAASALYNCSAPLFEPSSSPNNESSCIALPGKSCIMH